MPDVSRLMVVAALGLALGTAHSTFAAPPKITEVSPFGIQRGTPGEVTFNGSALDRNPRLIAPFGFELVGTPPAGSDAAKSLFRLKVPASTPIGVYPVRIQTDEGLSNPFLFAVGQLTQVPEKEDNSTFEQAQTFTAPAVVEGRAAGNDVDYFKFSGRKGQRVVVDAQCARIGSGVDPSIRLTTASRKFVASADDSPGLLTDARLFAVLPEDTDYVVELSDSRYQGGGRPVYRLVIGEVPAVEELYPLGARAGDTVGFEVRGGTLADPLGGIVAARVASASGFARGVVRVPAGQVAPPWPGSTLDVESLPSIVVSELPEVREGPEGAPPSRAAAPVSFQGRIDPEKDEDRFVVILTPGQKYRVAVEAAAVGSALDGTLQVLNAQGNAIASGDDSPLAVQTMGQAQAPPLLSPDPVVEFTAPASQPEVTIALKDLAARGGTGYPYRINVTPVVPDFLLLLAASEISVPRGGAAAVEVALKRQGHTGPITLDVVDPPPGLTVRPGTVATGQLVGSFTVSAAADASFGPVQLKVVGRADTPSGPLVRVADRELVFATQATLPTNSLKQTGLAAAPATVAPVTIDTPAAPIEVAHGLGTTITINVNRPKGAEGALALTPSPLPPGVAIPNAQVGEKATEAKVALNTTTDVTLGTMSVVLNAKGKVAGSDRLMAVPALTLNVVRPAEVSLAAPSVEVKPGATVEVKGKVSRKGTFGDPVTVKLNGLPGGTKADPVTVPAGQSDFTMKLVADAKAAPATASATAALAFQINKKDYPAPTAPLSVKVVPAK
ncbi:MAG: hypothetical protein U0794_08195 [Isosphaeraceae bacterium]